VTCRAHVLQFDQNADSSPYLRLSCDARGQGMYF
jgi:hypothetical protein